MPPKGKKRGRSPPSRHIQQKVSRYANRSPAVADKDRRDRVEHVAAWEDDFPTPGSSGKTFGRESLKHGKGFAQYSHFSASASKPSPDFLRELRQHVAKSGGGASLSAEELRRHAAEVFKRLGSGTEGGGERKRIAKR